MADGKDILRVDVYREDDSVFRFKRDQRNDSFSPPSEGSRFVRECGEDVKREAQETRERVRKAGLLP
jgi:hypothetical protein